MGVAKLTDQNTIVPDSKYSRIERERRYLLADLPAGLSRADHHLQITDNYLTGTRLRIRKVRDPRTNKWVVKFTQKFAPDPQDLSRTVITNLYLNPQEAETLAVFEANEIRKNRYPFEFGERKFSIDMFIGDLFGLVLAEVSFESDDELDSFPVPPFVFAEVTNNETFTGGRLAYLKFADLREEIGRLSREPSNRLLGLRSLTRNDLIPKTSPVFVVPPVSSVHCRKPASVGQHTDGNAATSTGFRLATPNHSR
jgi:CYTH domain-containing protein